MATLRKRTARYAPEDVQGVMNAYENPAATARQQAPYQQSRGSLREKWGPRTIGGPATASPRDNPDFQNRLAPADPATGKTSADNWNAFFRPVTAATSMFAPGAPGAQATRSFKSLGRRSDMAAGQPITDFTSPVGPAARPPVAPSIFSPDTVAARSGIHWGATDMNPAQKQASIRGFMDARVRPPLAPAPTDYLKAAFDDSAKFWNTRGAPIPAPMAGAVAAGTSFSSKYGTGSVGSYSGGLKRFLKRDKDYRSDFSIA